MTADTEERVARLEGAYAHLATKADVESLRGEMIGLRGEMRLLASLVTGVQIAAAALLFSRIAGQGHERDIIFRDVAADVPLPLVLRGLAPGTFARNSVVPGKRS